MGDKTKIEWTNFFGQNSGATWNPIAAFHKGKRGWACVKIDPACRHCYAQQINQTRPFGMGTGLPYDVESMSKVELDLVNLDQPIRWGKPRGIFVASMTDLFGNFVPEEYRRAIFVIMGFAQQHIFITLTKRIPEMVTWYLDQSHKPDFEIPQEYVTPAILKAWKKRNGAIGLFPDSNIIVGISIGNQTSADKALPYMKLLRQNYKNMKIMVSNEPALETVDFTGWEEIISWLVTGGESGRDARPMHPHTPYASRDWALKNNIPFFFKQWGEYVPCSTKLVHGIKYDGVIFVKPDGSLGTGDDWFYGKENTIPMDKVGKKQAGHLLDGIAYQQFPKV